MHLLTMKELMAFLKVKRNTVYQLRRLGLPAINLGRSVRFDRDEIVSWIRSNRSVTTKQPPAAADLSALDGTVTLDPEADFLL